jgi:Mor family transcriptional regulator
MIEYWRSIPGYEGKYEISNLGNVKSLDRIVKTKKGTRKYKGRMLKLANHTGGYLVVNLCSETRGVKINYVHKLVAEAFIGVSNLQVNHKDLNKKNNSLSNLEYVTNFENSLHAFKCGVKIGKTILNENQRQQIRELRSKGHKLKELACKFNVSESAISEVYRKTTWSWE